MTDNAILIHHRLWCLLEQIEILPLIRATACNWILLVMRKANQDNDTALVNICQGILSWADHLIIPKEMY